jgi:hypothetical protein
MVWKMRRALMGVLTFCPAPFSVREADQQGNVYQFLIDHKTMPQELMIAVPLPMIRHDDDQRVIEDAV